jgi:hypothetical protein
MACSTDGLLSFDHPFIKSFSNWVLQHRNASSSNPTRNNNTSSSSTTNRAANGGGGGCSSNNNIGMFDLHILDESKSNDTNNVPYLSALQCSGKNMMLGEGCSTHHQFASDDSTTMSYNNNDYDDEDEDDQMRRLASWGTYGTIGTNESLDNTSYKFNNVDSDTGLDDDGNPIDMQLLEKAIRNRMKIQNKNMGIKQNTVTTTVVAPISKKRTVQFAYPPITSLKQCPRIDPGDVDILFFSDEELATYEHDRRSTGVIDDVEIVAVSTSISSEEIPPAPTNTNNNTTNSSSNNRNTTTTKSKTTKAPSIVTSTNDNNKDTSPKPSFCKSFLLSPRPSRKACVETQPGIETKSKQQRQTLSPTKSKRRFHGNNNNKIDENSSLISPILTTDDVEPSSSILMKEEIKEKRLLKSVQIFLRARSTVG